MAKEFELKYQATEKILADIRGKFGDFSPISMETVYFDTPQADMRRLRWTLRRRLENGRAVCSLKTPGTGFLRGEWEWASGEMDAAIPMLCKLGAPDELATLAHKGLEAVCGAEFLRLAKILDLPDATVELALDRGSFLGGGQQVPFAEVEVELKSGSEAAALAFAENLAAQYGLTPEHRGKAERAMALMP